MKNISTNLNSGPMLNAYPDSIGGNLNDIVKFWENIIKKMFFNLYIHYQVFSIPT